MSGRHQKSSGPSRQLPDAEPLVPDESLLRAAMNTLPDSFAIYNAKAELIYGNATHLSAFPGGLRGKQLIGPSRMPLHDGRVMQLAVTPLPDGGRVVLGHDIARFEAERRSMMNAIAGADVGTWDWSCVSNINRVNERWASMLGYTRAELEPVTLATFATLLHPDDREPVRKAWNRLTAAKTTRYEIEFRLRHKAGHWIWVLSRGLISSIGEDGQAQAVAGVHSDITRLKHAEEQLRAVIDGAQVATWDWDIPTNRQTVNTYFAQMLGYRDVADLGTITYDIWKTMIHPDDLDRVTDEILCCQRGETEAYESEYRIHHRDGRWLWMLDRARVLRRDEAGRALYMAGVQLDISEQKAREAALLEALDERDRAERRLADIAAVSSDWFWEMDAQMVLRFVAESQLHLPNEKPPMGQIGVALGDWLTAHPDVAASADWQGLQAELAAGRTFADFVYRAPAFEVGGEERWLRISGTPILDGGKVQGYRGIGSDVTQLYLAKARAEAANLSKSQVVATISHELRTPLTGVLGMAEVLADKLSDPELQRMVGVIQASGQDLLTMLNDLLDMSKIEAGRMELESAVFAPVDLLGQLEDLHAVQADQKGIEFEVMIAAGADTPRMGDMFRLRQVLHNLVGNALKFTDKGRIRVKLAGRIDQPLMIEVSDSGIGMSAAELSRLFEDFGQADASISRRFGGTGLGLSITRRLIALMGGKLEVQSTLGHGTTVTATLPLPVALEPALSEKSGHRANLEGLHFLVADDNETNRLILRHLLEKLGATADLVIDGVQAVEAAGGAYDAILLDIAMPGMDGTAALAAMRERGIKVPIVAITANAMAHQVALYRSLGFADCVAKPMQVDRLLAAIRGALPQGR